MIYLIVRLVEQSPTKTEKHQKKMPYLLINDFFVEKLKI